MVKALLIESDPRVRDLIAVGLRNFPDFVVDHSDDAWAVEMAKERSYDLIIADIELAGGASGLDLVKKIRGFDPHVEVILVGRGKAARAAAKEKSAANVFAVLHLPFQEEGFFKLISRAKDRIESRA